MAVAKRDIRGLQDIRTLSGRVDQAFLPSRAYMKIACLEMEKARRGKERESAAYRMEIIDERFKEVEAEKDVLLRAVGERNGEDSTDHASHTESKSEPRRNAGGFKLKY